MNYYIKMQLNNMLRSLDAFEDACKLAALKDDGIIDSREQKQLVKIRKAAERFRNDLINLSKQD